MVDIDDELFNLLWKYSICYSILPCIYVECVDAQKYLNLHIDYKHSWRNHVASICKKMLTQYIPSYNYLTGYITKILYLYKGINY